MTTETDGLSIVYDDAYYYITTYGGGTLCRAHVYADRVAFEPVVAEYGRSVNPGDDILAVRFHGWYWD